MDPHVIALAALILFLGALLQGAIAFGISLFATPLLLAIGVPLPMALATMSLATAIQSASGAHDLRRTVPWRRVGATLPYRLAGLMAGLWTLRRLAAASPAAIRFWVGFAMLALTLLQSVWRPTPRPRLHPAWDAAALLTSGFCAGLVSMGGPALVLWVMAHDWDARSTRGFLFASFLCLVPVQLALLYRAFGAPVLRGLALAAILAPAILAGSLIGLRLGRRISKPLLLRMAYAVLVLIALNAMAPRAREWLRRAGAPPASETSP